MPRATVLLNGSGVNSSKCQRAKSQRPLTRTNDAAPISNVTPFITESISRRHNDQCVERATVPCGSCVRSAELIPPPSTNRHVLDTCGACVVAGARFRGGANRLQTPVPRTSYALPGRGRSEAAENDTRFGAVPSREGVRAVTCSPIHGGKRRIRAVGARCLRDFPVYLSR